MSNLSRAVCIALFVFSAGCYHAVVDTGAAPSTEIINRNWASSWIYGLVPPKPTFTKDRCPAGVAKVETKHSFLNQVVGFLTAGIFTPMQIIVTCAAGSSAATSTSSSPIVARGPSPAEVQAAFAEAIDQSRLTSKPVYIQF